jgi:hypothetical protein
MMWKEVVAAKFKALFWYLPEKTEEKIKKSQSGEQVF